MIDSSTLHTKAARRSRIRRVATAWITAVVGTMTGVLIAAGLLALGERAHAERAARASQGPTVIRAVLTTAAAVASTTPEPEVKRAGAPVASAAPVGEARPSAARPNQAREAERRASVANAANRRRRGSSSLEASAPAPRAASAPSSSDANADPASAPPPATHSPSIAIFDFPQAREMSADAAAVALRRTASTAAGCVEAGETRRGMGVSVTFMPTGRVSTATITSGPFAGTETGSCIAKALRSAIVGAFDGPPVTVSTYLRIQ